MLSLFTEKEGVFLEKVTQTVEETVKYMWRSQKNRLFMGLMLVFMVIYVLVFTPGFNSHHDLDVKSLEDEMTGNAVQAEHAKDNGLLSDNDRESLDKKGVEVNIDSKTKTFEEQEVCFTAYPLFFFDLWSHLTR